MNFIIQNIFPHGRYHSLSTWSSLYNISMDHTENITPKNSSSVACLFVAVERCLMHHCIVTATSFCSIILAFGYQDTLFPLSGCLSRVPWSYCGSTSLNVLLQLAVSTYCYRHLPLRVGPIFLFQLDGQLWKQSLQGYPVPPIATHCYLTDALQTGR